LDLAQLVGMGPGWEIDGAEQDRGKDRGDAEGQDQGKGTAPAARCGRRVRCNVIGPSRLFHGPRNS
jgi:hypothetical protein